MAEAPLAVASAVIVPEPAEQLSASPTLKRRQSSFSDDRSKRFRFENNEINRGQNSAASPPVTPLDRASERRKSGHLEERKRGQRLFGALLGTLSQSSSSTAQKRRTDIEKKQQAKLKLQDEEQDEKKKQRLEALVAVRRKEQVKFDKQSMRIRHSNMLAQAHFLQTKAEPKIYYKPWELLPGMSAKIKTQVEEVEALIKKECEQWDAEHPTTDPGTPTKKEEEPLKTEENGADASSTVGPITNNDEPPESREADDTNMNDASTPELQRESTEPLETSKDHADDGGEVVEGEEDTVIY